MIDLFIDTQGAQTEGSRQRGIGRYTRDLIRALARAADNKALYLGWNAALASPMPDMADLQSAGGTSLVSYPYGSVARRKDSRGAHDAEHEINDALLRHAIARSRCRHVLFSSVVETDTANFVLPKTLNYGPDVTSYAVLYDIIPYLYKAHYLPNEDAENTWRRHLHVQLSADILFAISERSRQDAIQHLGVDPTRIVNIGTGIDVNIFLGPQTDPEAFRKRHSLSFPFLFFLGGGEFRKNLNGFVAAITRLSPGLRANLQFLIAGAVDPDLKDKLWEEAKAEGIGKHQLIFAGHMSEEDLRCAYSTCAATVIPSLSEGFGLPVLEAMIFNSPIVASANTSMAEILDDDRVLCDAGDPSDIAAKIEFVLGNPEAIASIQATYAGILRQHDWDQVAKRALDIMRTRQSAPPPATHMAARQMHIRLHGTPSKDWINLIEALGQRHRVTVYGADAAQETLQALPVALHHHSALTDTPHDLPVLVMICDEAGNQEARTWGGLSEAVVLTRVWPVPSDRPPYLIYHDKGGAVIRHRISSAGADRVEAFGYDSARQLASVILDKLDGFADFSTSHLAARLRQTLKYYRRSDAIQATAEAAAVNVFDMHRL